MTGYPKKTVLMMGLLLTVSIVLSAQDKVTLAAASNLATLEKPLNAAWKAQYPGISLVWVFGASGALVTQILAGAPYDAFLSADMAYPQTLFKEGWAAAPPEIYARGKLVLLSVSPQDFSPGLRVLMGSQVPRFVLANPETAPYGRAAQEALQTLGLWDSVQSKAVTAQNITQAFQMTLTAAGWGFISLSSLETQEGQKYKQDSRFWFEVPQNLYTPLNQGWVEKKGRPGGPSPLGTFLRSPAVLQIFRSSGYSIP